MASHVMDDDLESIDDDDDLEQVAGSSAGPSEKLHGQSTSNQSGDKDKKHYFCKELRGMMYGFGDDKVPYTETVELLEDIVMEYVRNMTLRAMDVGKTGRVTLEDIWYLIRRQPRQYARVKELLMMNEELKKARKAFDEAKY